MASHPGATVTSQTDGLIDRLRHCREQLSVARTDLAETIETYGWATRRYESAASRARTTATAWSHTRGRWEATSQALRRQFVDAVACAERLRLERLEVSSAAKLLRMEIESIEHEMVGLAQQIGTLVDLEMKLGEGTTRPAC